MFTVLLYLYLIGGMTYLLAHDFRLNGFDLYALGFGALMFVLAYCVFFFGPVNHTDIWRDERCLKSST